MMKGKITGVSLGPGEPELITLKALKRLQEADVIYCPATRRADGEMKSKAADILRELPVDPLKIHYFSVPMSPDRTAVNQVYDTVCGEIVRHVDQGRSVAMTAEGDACFYSSANYIFSKLQQAGYPAEMVAGVPAFIAAGASVGLHLVKQQERLLVVPGDIAEAELEQALAAGHTVVIMKVPLGEKVLRGYMAGHPGLNYYYFEQVGCASEFHTSSASEILARPFTYFSILVIRK